MSSGNFEANANLHSRMHSVAREGITHSIMSMVDAYRANPSEENRERLIKMVRSNAGPSLTEYSLKVAASEFVRMFAYALPILSEMPGVNHADVRSAVHAMERIQYDLKKP